MEDTCARILESLEALKAADFDGHEKERLQLIACAKKLTSRLELDEEKVAIITLLNPPIYSAVKIFIDIGLWVGWSAAGGGERQVEDITKLAAKDCDVNIVSRLLRLLASANIIEETGEDRYKPTRFSLSIGIESTSTSRAQALVCMNDHWGPGALNFPSFLAKTSYREPLDTKYSNYHDSYPEKMSLFERPLTNQAYQKSWASWMTEWTKYKMPWPEYYDTTTLVDEADLSDGKPLVVDIGGLSGVDLLSVSDKHPNIPDGCLILQDLPDVVSGVNLDKAKIKVMGHDFFKPQPVHGSRAYFFHGVFHDWPDSDAMQILKNLAPAMKKGYSKLLICEIVIPPTSATIWQAGMDMTMMAFMSSRERTEAMWRSLMREAGFKINGIWKDPRNYESVIEAELE
ncbi:putative O-methyltransferase [Hypoxylon sp. FL1284]|nr:putative O-methyltransferase [Hypoxylon sp. FL1284]